MIIGITGFIGAGKTELAQLFVKRGFIKKSFGDQVRKIATLQSIPITRENLQNLGDTYRKEKGGDVWAKLIIEELEPDKNYVIEGIRNPEEIEAFSKRPDFILIGLEAQLDIRAQRIISRNRENDPKNMDEFVRVDNKDKGIGQEQLGQNSLLCFQKAQHYISNNTNLIDLEKQVEIILKKIEIKEK